MQPQITLTLSLEQVNLILQALEQQPYRLVAGLIPTIQVSAQAQLGALQRPAPPAEPPGEPA